MRRRATLRAALLFIGYASPSVFSLDGGTLCGLEEILGGERRGVDGEFRDIVGLEQADILFRIPLRQQERFMGAAFRIEPGQIEACVGPVVAAGREDDPTAVRRPTVITLRLFAVDFRKRP